MPEVRRNLRLLPAEALAKTNGVDHAEWNYRPVLGAIQRRRFRLIQQLLLGRRYSRLLEIGYGSGVFMPELARHTDELHGIDPHPHPAQVAANLADYGVRANLITGSATALPYESASFDAVVVVSALEFIPDLQASCQEFCRLLTEGGVLVVVTPGQSPLLDLGLKLLTGESAANDFGARRATILPTLAKYFYTEKRLDSPAVLHRLVRLYTALRLQPKQLRTRSDNRNFRPNRLPFAHAGGYHAGATVNVG